MAKRLNCTLAGHAGHRPTTLTPSVYVGMWHRTVGLVRDVRIRAESRQERKRDQLTAEQLNLTINMKATVTAG